MAGSQKFELQLNKIVLEWDHRPNFLYDFIIWSIGHLARFTIRCNFVNNLTWPDLISLQGMFFHSLARPLGLTKWTTGIYVWSIVSFDMIDWIILYFHKNNFDVIFGLPNAIDSDMHYCYLTNIRLLVTDGLRKLFCSRFLLDHKQSLTTFSKWFL